MEMQMQQPRKSIWLLVELLCLAEKLLSSYLHPPDIIPRPSIPLSILHPSSIKQRRRRCPTLLLHHVRENSSGVVEGSVRTTRAQVFLAAAERV